VAIIAVVAVVIVAAGVIASEGVIVATTSEVVIVATASEAVNVVVVVDAISITDDGGHTALVRAGVESPVALFGFATKPTIHSRAESGSRLRSITVPTRVDRYFLLGINGPLAPRSRKL
jgi:hypothetical protein